MFVWCYCNYYFWLHGNDGHYSVQLVLLIIFMLSLMKIQKVFLPQQSQSRGESHPVSAQTLPTYDSCKRMVPKEQSHRGIYLWELGVVGLTALFSSRLCPPQWLIDMGIETCTMTCGYNDNTLALHCIPTLWLYAIMPCATDVHTMWWWVASRKH